MNLKVSLRFLFTISFIFSGGAYGQEPLDFSLKNKQKNIFVDEALLTETGLGRHRRKPLQFRFKKTTTIQTSGTTIYDGVFYDLEGKLLHQEVDRTFSGKLQEMQIQQYQTEQSAKVTVKGNQVTFEKTKNGKTKTDSETFKGDLLVAGMVGPYISQNWQRLVEKKEVLKVRFAVWDRMETVGFSIRWIKESKKADQELSVFEMKPSSYFIQLLVNPIRLAYEKDGNHDPVWIEGRTAVKRKERGKWRDLNGRFEY